MADRVKKYPDRLIQFADVDCAWTNTHHRTGAAERLATAAQEYQLKGYAPRTPHTYFTWNLAI